ncbi:hypothetical protein F3Y22_tig00110597pilonHSYRG00179 [Hibiscus syriacus]|uniref:Uncharacterized protein n=1 Tax=Hibiscus syriacus TaxID=106335 RepID=A0A6A3A292_HIBSY|nr:hypothetical protein F3Y22_tig00110597pilonHSYRG00179 [Hibiscus syriacus]
MITGSMHSYGFKGVVIFLGLTLCYVLGEGELGLATSKQKNLGAKKPNNPPRHAVKSIQLEPSYIPNKEESPTSEQPSRTVTSQQIWRRNGSYPKGTIPKAIVLTGGYNYAGIKGDMRVYQPFVEFDIISGPWYDFECVQVGWVVNPRTYGDRETRLFAPDSSNIVFSLSRLMHRIKPAVSI